MGQYYSGGQQWDSLVVDNSGTVYCWTIVGQYSGGQQWDSIVVDNSGTV